jgi:hypothetical protein
MKTGGREGGYFKRAAARTAPKIILTLYNANRVWGGVVSEIKLHLLNWYLTQMAHRIEKTYHNVAVVGLEVIYLLYFTCYIAFFYSFTVPDTLKYSEDLPQLVYTENSSVPGSPVISQKHIPIILCQSRINRYFFTRISCTCADDKIIDVIIQYNRQIFQSIQLGTSISFNCELQI